MMKIKTVFFFRIYFEALPTVQIKHSLKTVTETRHSKYPSGAFTRH